GLIVRLTSTAVVGGGAGVCADAAAARISAAQPTMGTMIRRGTIAMPSSISVTVIGNVVYTTNAVYTTIACDDVRRVVMSFKTDVSVRHVSWRETETTHAVILVIGAMRRLT